jgi:hypothetical protein
MNTYETQLRNLEEERDRFRRELHKYKRSAKEKVNLLKKIRIKLLKFIQDVEENQLAKALREKEDLQLLLNKFERHMAEVHSENFINNHFYSFLFYSDSRKYKGVK